MAGEGKKAIYELTGEENTLPNLTGKMGGKAAKNTQKSQFLEKYISSEGYMFTAENDSEAIKGDQSEKERG